MDLKSRLRNLSPAQRRLLAHRMGGRAARAERAETGHQHLAAYFVPAPGKTATDRDLRRFLLDRLPSYMVPSTFARLEALPVTPNGKVDRTALLHSLHTIATEHDSHHASLHSETEVHLAGIWSQVLGVEAVGIHDNFFELGGHSLLAVQVLSQIRGTLQIELPMRALFEAPTIAELAQYIDTVQWTRQDVQGRVSDSGNEREDIVI